MTLQFFYSRVAPLVILPNITKAAILEINTKGTIIPGRRRNGNLYTVVFGLFVDHNEG